MSGEREALVRVGLNLADDLDGRMMPSSAALVRRLCRAVTAGPLEPAEDTCPWCGAAVVQPARGRHRRWCSDACRKAAAKRRRNS